VLVLVKRSSLRRAKGRGVGRVRTQERKRPAVGKVGEGYPALPDAMYSAWLKGKKKKAEKGKQRKKRGESSAAKKRFGIGTGDGVQKQGVRLHRKEAISQNTLWRDVSIHI